jgi:hypothetical protein
MRIAEVTPAGRVSFAKSLYDLPFDVRSRNVSATPTG